MTHLQGLNCIYRKNQHQDLQQQTISDPDNQNQLKPCKNNQGPAQSQTPCDHEAYQTAEYVTEGVNYGITLVSECGSLRAVAINNEAGVFKHLPQGFDGHSEHQLPV